MPLGREEIEREREREREREIRRMNRPRLGEGNWGFFLGRSTFL
jgi:hypothetical protein